MARFSADSEAPRVFDCGEGYFTGPSGFVDPKTGRAILFSIAQGARSSRFDYDSGWAHSAGMPVELRLGADDDLYVRPIREVDALRGPALLTASTLTLAAANAALRSVRGGQFDIEFRLPTAAPIGISVRRTPAGTEHTDILFDPVSARFETDRTRATLDQGESDTRRTGGTVKVAAGPLSFRLLVDGSLIEAYLNEKYSLTTRAYPRNPDADGMALLGAPDLLIDHICVYPMQSINAA